MNRSVCTCARLWLQPFQYGVIILLKVTPRYVKLFARIFHLFNCSTLAGTPKSSGGRAHLIFPFIDLYFQCSEHVFTAASLCRSLQRTQCLCFPVAYIQVCLQRKQDEFQVQWGIIYIYIKKLSYPCCRPWRPIGERYAEDSILSRHSALTWRLGCQPYAPAALYTQKYLLVFISVSGGVNPTVMVWLEGFGKVKKLN
jgi:hypothetical protein